MLFDPYAVDVARSARTEEALLAVPEEARGVLWCGLTEAVAGALELWEQTPPGARYALPSFAVQHAGKRRFEAEALREQTLAGWHRLMGLELRLGVEALEALIYEESARYRALLAEQCGRVGQLYDELKRRAGMGVALWVLYGELRLLRYRASEVVAPLVYD